MKILKNFDKCSKPRGPLLHQEYLFYCLYFENGSLVNYRLEKQTLANMS